MGFLTYVIVLAVSLLVGIFGFSQVIGSIQNIGQRPVLIITLILWIAILVGVYLLAKRIVPGEMITFYIGYGIAFVLVLSSGKIK